MIVLDHYRGEKREGKEGRKEGKEGEAKGKGEIHLPFVFIGFHSSQVPNNFLIPGEKNRVGRKC